MARAVGASALFLAAWIALTLNHPPAVPLRGQLSYFLDFVLSKTALFALMWLAFFVADQVRLASASFAIFLGTATPTGVETLQRFGQSAAAATRALLRLRRHPRSPSAARWWETPSHHPFFALVFFVGARVEFFDAGPGLCARALVGTCFVMMVLAFLLLRLTAYPGARGRGPQAQPRGSSSCSARARRRRTSPSRAARARPREELHRGAFGRCRRSRCCARSSSRPAASRPGGAAVFLRAEILSPSPRDDPFRGTIRDRRRASAGQKGSSMRSTVRPTAAAFSTGSPRARLLALRLRLRAPDIPSKLLELESPPS